ncbi:MAG: fibronectin type III domain-containing protein [Bacteroidetes bacterium]|nr:fibronectin type III domain-containing protein [Bacteroidota bacterium]
MPIFMREYATLSASVRSKIRIVGFKWFKYEGMPKDSSTTTLNSVPTGISATPSSTSASLSWGAVSGATGYRIMYAKANSYSFTTVNATTNSHTLSGLTANTAYHFLVYSVISGKLHKFSTYCVYNNSIRWFLCAAKRIIYFRNF